MDTEIITEVARSNPSLPGFETPRITATPTGLVFGDEAPDMVEIEDILVKAAKMRESSTWIIGDAINWVKATTGSFDYVRASKLTRLEVSTLMRVALVAKNVPLSVRKERLSFDHHRAVACLKNPDDQAMWLETASKKEMSGDVLRKSIKLGRVATKEDMEKPTGGGIDNAIPHVNRLCVFRRSLEDAGWFDEVDEEMLYSLHKDLLPVVEFHAYVGQKIATGQNYVVANEYDEDIKKIRDTYKIGEI
jgi:hypothetical protein